MVEVPWAQPGMDFTLLFDVYLVLLPRRCRHPPGDIIPILYGKIFLKKSPGYPYPDHAG